MCSALHLEGVTVNWTVDDADSIPYLRQCVLSARHEVYSLFRSNQNSFTYEDLAYTRFYDPPPPLRHSTVLMY